MNSPNPVPHSNKTLKTNTLIFETNADLYILDLVISNFIRKHNELIRQQKEDTIKMVQESSENLKCTVGNRKKVNADCKAKLKIIVKTYKNARKQIKKEFKEFRKTTESLIKAAKALELIDKEEVKHLKYVLSTFEKETSNAEKIFKNEAKSGAYRNLLSIFQT